MNSKLLRTAASFVPRPLRQRLRESHQEWVFKRAMVKFVESPQLYLNGQHGRVDELVYGWGNESWSADSRYLAACLSEANRSPLPVLECGSGLSTLLLGAVCQSRGIELWSLEHLPKWAARTREGLSRFGIQAAKICMAPLRSYGDFDWYDPPLEQMPKKFGLVVCDGPPSTTTGGRYGLAPVMGATLSPGCVILLDDANRPSEADVADRWSRELPCTFSFEESAHGHFRAVVA